MPRSKPLPGGTAVMPFRRRRPKEVFAGPRLAVAVPLGARARSVALLVLISVVFGIVLATGLAWAVWYLVQTITHALAGS